MKADRNRTAGVIANDRPLENEASHLPPAPLIDRERSAHVLCSSRDLARCCVIMPTGANRCVRVRFLDAFQCFHVTSWRWAKKRRHGGRFHPRVTPSWRKQLNQSSVSRVARSKVYPPSARNQETSDTVNFSFILLLRKMRNFICPKQEILFYNRWLL